MCGIAGMFGRNSVSSDTLYDMGQALTNRGPDEYGIYQSGSFGIVHRRLSIIDLETGKQPIFNEDESVCVIFNGEIYNYSSLRETLSSRGHTFTTDTDTEVLVHLYEEHGPSFVDRLEGMFAFALWDSNDERLLLARDPMGIKPLFLARSGGEIAFASEILSLLESGVDHGGLDRQSIAQYFSLSHIPAPRTAFSNISKVEPGEVVRISEGDVTQRQFYRPSVEPQDHSFEEAATELRARLEKSVEQRLMSDVPLGAFLSGGIDSSIVVGTMANLTDDPIETFTVGFEESLFDESWAARAVADYHNTDHTEYTVTPDEVRDAIPAVLDRLGEPFADQSIIPTYIVSRETSNNVKVALSGDGADELFAGYSRYRGEYYSQYYRMLPSIIRRSVLEPTIDGLDVARDSSRGEFVRKVQKFTRGGIADVPARHFEWARIAEDDALDSLGVPAADSGRDILRQQHEVAQSYVPSERQDAMSRIQAVDTYFGLPNQILHKTDQASMYNSLEVRVPFLDTDIVEYAMSLPTEYKITPRKRKRILKRAFDDVLPDSILERGKQGFDMPIGEWFKDELADEFTETISAVETDLVDTDAVMDCFAEHSDGRREHGKFLWSVYVFARWHNRMVENGVLEPA